MRGLLRAVEEVEGETRVTDTSRGTLPTSDYANVPVGDQLPHGVGAWLMAASERLRAERRYSGWRCRLHGWATSSWTSARMRSAWLPSQ